MGLSESSWHVDGPFDSFGQIWSTSGGEFGKKTVILAIVLYKVALARVSSKSTLEHPKV